jgi:type IV fimbrial biogenesis protein FimT
MKSRSLQSFSPGLNSPGFTLIEVMVVIAVIAVLTSLAAPSFSEFIKNQRIKSMASDLNASLTLARSEAVKRNRSVTISPESSPLPPEQSWPNGWRIADPDNPGSNIEVHEAFTGLTATGPTDVTYRSSGRLQGNIAPQFNISAAGASSKRCVTVDLSGRPYIKDSAC